MIYAEYNGSGKLLRTQIFTNDPGHPWKVYAPLEIELTPEEKKEVRAEKVNSIVVEVAGKLFDGDEDAQNRINRAITALTVAGVLSTPWKLADNSWTEVTVEQLAEVLVKAGMEQTRLWSLA